MSNILLILAGLGVLGVAPLLLGLIFIYWYIVIPCIGALLLGWFGFFIGLGINVLIYVLIEIFEAIKIKKINLYEIEHALVSFIIRPFKYLKYYSEQKNNFPLVNSWRMIIIFFSTDVASWGVFVGTTIIFIRACNIPDVSALFLSLIPIWLIATMTNTHPPSKEFIERFDQSEK